jgi:tetratricopeptide (TPR) repeat protein
MDDTPRIADLRKKLDKDPGSRLFAQLAEELRKEGRFEDAIEVAQTGLQKNPNYPSARLTLARAQLDSNRPGEARAELEQIVKASPDNILASRLLGEALEDLGEREGAIRQFERTLRLSPEDKGLAGKLQELRSKAATRPAPAPPVLPPVAASNSQALDRDLASGSFRPGSFSPADLPWTAPRTAPAPAPAAEARASPRLPSMGDTVAFGQLGQSGAAPAAPKPPVAEEPQPAAADQARPAVAVAPEAAHPGSQTLPVTSMTLADLYMQQGLKAEASAVLSQVLQEEPENAQVRAKLAAVSGPPSQERPEIAPPATEGRGIAGVPSGPAVASEAGGRARATEPAAARAEARERSIFDLKAFLGAVEREATYQRATETGVFR